MGDWMDEWGQYGPQGERKERLDALRARLDARPRPDVESEDEDEGPRQDEREEDREDEPTERIPVEPAGEAESTAPLDLEAVAEAGGTEDATAGPSHRRALRAAAIVLAVLAAGGVGAAAVSGVQASQIRGLQASCQDARHAQGQAFDRLDEAMHGDAAALSRLPASAVQDPGKVTALAALLRNAPKPAAADCAAGGRGGLHAGIDALDVLVQLFFVVLVR